MSTRFDADSEELAAIRDEARTLVRHAEAHALGLEALVAAAEADVEHDEAALSDALDLSRLCVDHLRDLLSSHWQRSVGRARLARRLCTDARGQHVAARRLLTHLDTRPDLEEQLTEPGTDGVAVLVADDYGEVRDLVATVLQNAGFVVRTAANGLEALLAAYEMRPAVIVMDLTMPVLDGIEATRLIKAADATRHARVIAYTGEPTLDRKAAQTLFTAVLEKPVPPAVVLATVRHVTSL